MEKRYALFLEVLGRFQAAGLLEELILIGSWCQHFYRSYFKGMRYTPSIRTRDMDFLVRDNCRATGFWVKKSKLYNFLLIMHEHLFVFQKTAP